ncbi:MAG: lysophospholipid acyltransferase family protein, partial [Chlamydiota bacterium]
GGIITKLNTHPLKGDVGDVAVFKLIVRLLREGKKVILFPEGQRSFDDIMTPIKPGISLLAFKADAAIIPAYIFGTFEAWPRKRRFPKIGKKIGCVFGSPLIWENVHHLDRKEAQVVFASQIKEAIEGLKKWYEAGAHGVPP